MGGGGGIDVYPLDDKVFGNGKMERVYISIQTVFP